MLETGCRADVVESIVCISREFGSSHNNLRMSDVLAPVLYDGHKGTALRLVVSASPSRLRGAPGGASQGG